MCEGACVRFIVISRAFVSIKVTYCVLLATCCSVIYSFHNNRNNSRFCDLEICSGQEHPFKLVKNVGLSPQQGHPWDAAASNSALMAEPWTHGKSAATSIPDSGNHNRTTSATSMSAISARHASLPNSHPVLCTCEHSENVNSSIQPVISMASDIVCGHTRFCNGGHHNIC